MLSSARCRALLGPDYRLTEAQLEQLRQDLYALAEVAVESVPRYQAAPATKAERRAGAASLDEGYEAAERAAILEFDAGLCRSEAEDKVKLRSKKRVGSSNKTRL